MTTTTFFFKPSAPGGGGTATVDYVKVDGTSAEDAFISGFLREFFDGGDALDSLSFRETGKGVSVNLAKGTVIDGYGNKEAVKNVEIVFGTSQNDTLIGSANTDYLIGGAGNDTIRGGAGNDEIYGGDGNDKIQGDAGSDYLVGGRGKDSISGGSGFDTVDYGQDGGEFGVIVDLSKGTAIDTYGDVDTLSGIERVRGTAFDDVITGGNGRDMLDGRDGNDVLSGGAGNDTLSGDGGNDTVDGGNGNDLLFGGFNDDALTGGQGNDTLVGDHGQDTIDGGIGSDTIDYSRETGWRGVGVDLRTGFAEDTWFNLDVLKNVENIVGTRLDDWLMGSDGNNVIRGGQGNDWLGGRGGRDTFVFAAGDGDDRIVDFEIKADKIDLTAMDFATKEEVLARAIGVDVGVMFDFGNGSAVTFVDVNIRDIGAIQWLL